MDMKSQLYFTYGIVLLASVDGIQTAIAFLVTFLVLFLFYFDTYNLILTILIQVHMCRTVVRFFEK